MDVVLQYPGREGQRWHDAFVRALPEARVHRWPDAPSEADVALVWRPADELFERVRIRRAVFNLGAGVDAVVELRSLPRDVPLLRLEDAGMAEQMVEYSLHAVLRAYRELDAYAESQRGGRWERRERIDKASFGVGILGLGTLGRAVADAVRALGFAVAGWSRTLHRVEGFACFAGSADLPPFLARSRVLIVLLPSTPATRNLLDRETLGALPRGAHLVNVARGDLLVDADLLALLDEGHLAGATIDVFHDEPLPSAHPFWHHPRITLTPHVSAVTLLNDSVEQVAAKLRALWRGEAVTGVVDRERGY